MELKQDKANHNDNQVDRYDPDQHTLFIKGVPFKHSIILSAHDIQAWSPQSMNSLRDRDFLPIVEKKPKLVLLGTGPHQIFPSDEILSYCIQANIPVEIMDTGAACRTFNLLVADSRQVIAAMLT